MTVNPWNCKEGSPGTLHAIWESAFTSLHPAYAVSPGKLHQLASADNATVFVTKVDGAVVGFAITSLIAAGCAANPAGQHWKGSLAFVAVHPSHQRRGYGSALHAAALAHLEGEVRNGLARSSPPAASSTIQLGSTFPRIFPGLPDLPALAPAKAFFTKHGWELKPADSWDLYGALPNDIDLDAYQKTALSHGISFRPALATDKDELMKMEYAEFDSYTGWPDMFPKMLANDPRDVHLALDKHGVIIGATIAAMPGSPMHAGQTWPDMLGRRCGALGAVGVSARSRGQGAGVGICAAAIQELVKRGADGVFIDWASMVGFYERFGPRKWEAMYSESARWVSKSERGHAYHPSTVVAG